MVANGLALGTTISSVSRGASGNSERNLEAGASKTRFREQFDEVQATQSRSALTARPRSSTTEQDRATHKEAPAALTENAEKSGQSEARETPTEPVTDSANLVADQPVLPVLESDATRLGLPITVSEVSETPETSSLEATESETTSLLVAQETGLVPQINAATRGASALATADANSLAGDQWRSLPQGLVRELEARGAATNSAAVMGDVSEDGELAGVGVMSLGANPVSAKGVAEDFASLIALAKNTDKTLNLTPGMTASADAQAVDAALDTIAEPAPPTATRPLDAAAQTQRAQTLPAFGHAFGQPGWSNEVGEKVLWMAAQNLKHAEIRLDPPELGSMQVRVSVQQDQVQVSFASAHVAVREALDSQASRLRDMLAEQGMNLVDVDVSDRRGNERGDERTAEAGFDGENDESSSVIAQTLISSEHLVDDYV